MRGFIGVVEGKNEGVVEGDAPIEREGVGVMDADEPGEIEGEGEDEGDTPGEGEGDQQGETSLIGKKVRITEGPDAGKEGTIKQVLPNGDIIIE